MISHSPPIFSHSPPVSFLSDYMSGNHRQTLNYNDETNRASRYCRPQVITLASKAMVNNASNAAAAATQQRLISGGVGIGNNSTQIGFTLNGVRHGNSGRQSYLERMVSAPHLNAQPKSCLSRKSCLHKTTTKATTAANNNSSNNNCDANAITATAAQSATNTNDKTVRNCEKSRTRKKVIFADDEGLSLTEVRVMSEPSNVPPYWSMKFLEQITQGLVSPHPADQWTVDFKQPASDYLTFRQKIERDFVSLENVIVKDEESIVVGTVKVKNVDFEKEVIVRVTWDDWKSQQDIFCTYNRAYGPSTCAHVVFDTFSFKITLPPSSKRLEFCICYRTKEAEHWDNNNNKNYTISKRSPFYYNALSPYEKGAQNRNACQNQLRSALSEALAKTHEHQQTWNEPNTPYW